MTLYTAGHLHTAVPHCSHSRAPIVHTAVPRENNEHGCVYLRCRAVCKLPGCVEGHPWKLESRGSLSLATINHDHVADMKITRFKFKGYSSKIISWPINACPCEGPSQGHPHSIGPYLVLQFVTEVVTKCDGKVVPLFFLCSGCGRVLCNEVVKLPAVLYTYRLIMLLMLPSCIHLFIH